MATGSNIHRVLCRLSYIASSPTHAQEIVALLGSALRQPSFCSSQRLHLGNALLEIHALPSWVATARHSGLLNRPVLARLCGVEVFGEEDVMAHASTRKPRRAAAAGDDARVWLTEDRPVVTPTLAMVSDASSIITTTTTTPPLVKEIVLGAGPRMNELATLVQEDLHAQPFPTLSHVYALGGNDTSTTGGIAMRLLPSIMSSLVLQVPCMTQAKEDLWARKVPFEEIGSTGATEGQVLLSSPLLRGLDVRLCDGGAPISPFFNEGDEVLREGVFTELNPALDKPLEGGAGAQGSAPAAAYRRSGTGMGDCWSEFRTQLRRPSGFFSSR